MVVVVVVMVVSDSHVCDRMRVRAVWGGGWLLVSEIGTLIVTLPAVWRECVQVHSTLMASPAVWRSDLQVHSTLIEWLSTRAVCLPRHSPTPRCDL